MRLHSVTLTTAAAGAVLLAAAVAAQAGTIVVDPGNMNGWATTNFGAAGTNASNAFVAGVGTPPLGSGSWSSDTAAPAGSYGNRIYTSAFSGTLLTDITEWSYASNHYDPASGVTHTFSVPYARAYVDLDGDGVADDRLVFEPFFQQGHPGVGGMTAKNLNSVWATQNSLTTSGVPTNTWYTWDLLAGAWYSSTGVAAGAQELVTIAGLIADFGTGVRLMDGATNSALFGTTGGTVHLQDGFNGDFALTGYVDAYRLNTVTTSVTYDFEPARAVPLPTSAFLGLGLLGGLGVAARVRRRRPATDA